MVRNNGTGKRLLTTHSLPARSLFHLEDLENGVLYTRTKRSRLRTARRLNRSPVSGRVVALLGLSCSPHGIGLIAPLLRSSRENVPTRNGAFV